MTPEAIATIVSALVATAALFLLWKQWRESTLRSGDVLVWANEVIYALECLLLICILKESQLEAPAAKSKLTKVIFNTAILIERGRLFFKNEVTDGFGAEKQSAYRGYRPRILDPIVVAHQVACEWSDADEDT